MPTKRGFMAYMTVIFLVQWPIWGGWQCAAGAGIFALLSIAYRPDPPKEPEKAIEDTRARWLAVKGVIFDVSFPVRTDQRVVDCLIGAAKGDVYELLDALADAEQRVEALEQALEALADAVPKQTNDCDWWQDDLTEAMRVARALLAPQEKA